MMEIQTEVQNLRRANLSRRQLVGIAKATTTDGRWNFAQIAAAQLIVAQDKARAGEKLSRLDCRALRIESDRLQDLAIERAK